MSTSGNKGLLVGLGLVFGAAIGTLFFIFSNDAWHIAAGAGIGIVVGSIAESFTKKD